MKQPELDYDAPVRVSVTPQEQRLLWFFHEMDDTGKRFLFDLLRALVCTGIYTLPNTSEEIQRLRKAFEERLKHRQEISKEPIGEDLPDDF